MFQININVRLTAVIEKENVDGRYLIMNKKLKESEIPTKPLIYIKI